MRPSRRVLPKALLFTMLAGLLSAGTACAQFYDPALRSLDLTSDVSRSPRLLGMGGLSLVVPDRNGRLTLWDWAGNPLGVYGDDSTSTIDLRPGTGAATGVHDRPSDGVRQDLAGRGTSTQFEMYHRDHDGNLFGVVGALSSVRSDRPYDVNEEVRSTVGDPHVLPIMAGPFPYFGGGKLRYALHMQFGSERVVDQYRAFVANAAGEFISLDGTTLTPPDLFTPTNYNVRTTGIGGGFSYPLGQRTILAFDVATRTERISGFDNGNRATSQVNENRPIGSGQASLIGRLGKSLEYGIDAQGWKASSQQDWVFTVSAGVGAFPLEGRGKLFERREEGSALRTRARWTSGPFELGGQVWTHWTRVNIDPPAAGDQTSLNIFLNQVFYHPGADSLVMPDSVVANEQNDRAWGYGLGASWKSKRAVAGLEWHWTRDAYDQAFGGPGPKRIGWDLRSGFEYQCSKVVTGRAGAGLSWADPDDYVRENEMQGRSISLGMGVRPVGASWNLDLGWTILWLQSDYGDPQQHRGSRQQLASQVHWSF
jgi:hypothetical protein